MRNSGFSRFAIIGLLAILGTVFVQAPASAQSVIIEDDFNDPAGTMPSPGNAPNTDPAWRFNDSPPSGLLNMYDGNSVLIMPMEPSGGFDQYIDADIELVAGNAYAYVIVFSYPPNVADGGGDQQPGFGGNVDWLGSLGDADGLNAATNQRGFYLTSTNIGFSDDLKGPNEGEKLTWVGTGMLVNDAVQSLMMRVSDTGVITVYYFDGDLRDTDPAGWTELTQRDDVFGDESADLFQMEFGPNVVGVQHFYGVPNRTGDTFDLDYIGLTCLTCTAGTPTPTPTATATPTPTPTPTPEPTPAPRGPNGFRDDFNDVAHSLGTWTIVTADGFSVNIGGGQAVFDADDVSDPADGSFADWNFDNQWDKSYLVSQVFCPRELFGFPTEVEFGVSSYRSTAWYIGFTPVGTDAFIDPQMKFGGSVHYFWLGADNPFHTFWGGPTWTNPGPGSTVGSSATADAGSSAAADGDPDIGRFRITLDPTAGNGPLWERHNGTDWETWVDSRGMTDGTNPFSSATDFQVLINYDGGNDAMSLDYVQLKCGDSIPVEMSSFVVE